MTTTHDVTGTAGAGAANAAGAGVPPGAASVAADVEPAPRRRVALFDLDDSLADFTGAMLRDLNRLRHPSEPEATHDDISSSEPHLLARVAMIKSQPGWWRLLRPLAVGSIVLQECRRVGYEVHVCSRSPKKLPVAWMEKVQWAQAHVDPDVDIKLVADKSLVYGRLLFDDYPGYITPWLKARPRGLVVMPQTQSNADFRHPRLIRVRTSDVFDERLGVRREDAVKAIAEAIREHRDGDAASAVNVAAWCNRRLEELRRDAGAAETGGENG